MKNQAQMKQELELWEQDDTQQLASYTQPIPQQNQQSDIQPMFDMQRSPAQATRRHAPQKQTRYPAPRQNIQPRQNPHMRQNPYAHPPQGRTQNPNIRQRRNMQQPPYMPQSSHTRQNPHTPARHNNTRANPYARQYANTISPPYKASPVKQPRNKAIQQTARTLQNTNAYRQNTPKRNQTPRRQPPQKIRRSTAVMQKKQTCFPQIAVLIILVIPVAIFLWTKFRKPEVPAAVTPAITQKNTEQEAIRNDTANHPPIEEKFLTISEYNRPGTKLASVKNIFVHYTANPGTSAAQNRSYFENLSETHERSASAHFIIGCEGEVIQCIPLEEEAYAVIGRNNDSISIECCYRSKDGKFTQDTYDSLISMLAWLINEYQLEPTDILRHYDCGGKRCPLYYVEHEDAWYQLLEDVANYQAENNLAAL